MSTGGEEKELLVPQFTKISKPTKIRKQSSIRELTLDIDCDPKLLPPGSKITKLTMRIVAEYRTQDGKLHTMVFESTK